MKDFMTQMGKDFIFLENNMKKNATPVAGHAQRHIISQSLIFLMDHND